VSESKERLLKRLKHNSEKIKDVTVKTLLADAYRFILFNSEETLSDLQTQLDEAKKKQIAVFDGDEYPSFRQGEPNHELEELFTAEAATNVMNKLKEAHEQIDSLKANAVESKEVPEEDKDAANTMLKMTQMFEEAGYSGIVEAVNSPKGRYPPFVTPVRADGRIVALEVELEEGTTITLRNPECVEQESAAQIAANADVTPKTRS